MQFGTTFHDLDCNFMLTFSQNKGIKYPIMTLAEKLRQLRNKREFSMTEVAQRSGRASDPRGRITQGYISRLESGKETNPSLQKLMTLCRIYKVTPNELLSGVLRSTK